MELNLSENDIKVKFVSFSIRKTDVKLHINKISNEYVFNISMKLKHSRVENIYTMYFKVADETKKLVGKSGKIPEDVFRFHGKQILKDKKLEVFYSTMCDAIKSAKNNDESSKKHYSSIRESNDVYFHYIRSLPKGENISEKTKQKVRKVMFSPEEFIKYLQQNHLNAVFTNDIRKQKIPRLTKEI